MRASVLYGKRDMRVEDYPDAVAGPGQVLVRIGAAGICGSDLHYFQHGANGTIVLKQPLVLGHEIAGTIEALGEGVDDLRVGQKAVVNPSRPCGDCEDCRTGNAVHCKRGTFMGSAQRFPHIQGGFRDAVAVDRSQVFPISDDLPLADAVFAEPLAVCLHALSRAGNLMGARVLVTGAGPIGLLVVMLARHAGASFVVSTDISDDALGFAGKVGAHETVNVAAGTAGLDAVTAKHGLFDIAFECSGHPSGVAASIEALRTCGTLVQVGMLGREVAAPLGAIVIKEIDYRGTFRFDREFGAAVELISSGALDFKPMLSHRVPFDDIVSAMDLAADRSRAMKVQVVFGKE